MSQTKTPAPDQATLGTCDSRRTNYHAEPHAKNWSCEDWRPLPAPKPEGLKSCPGGPGHAAHPYEGGYHAVLARDCRACTPAPAPEGGLPEERREGVGLFQFKRYEGWGLTCHACGLVWIPDWTFRREVPKPEAFPCPRCAARPALGDLGEVVEELERLDREMTEQYGPVWEADEFGPTGEALTTWWIHTPFHDDSCSSLGQEMWEETARFIVAMRNALPRLLARLRGEGGR